MIFVVVVKVMGFFKDVFVVGVKGEVDVMSIVVKVVEFKVFIIVNGWNDFLVDVIKLMDGKEIGIVGGFNNVFS